LVLLALLGGVFAEVALLAPPLDAP
jgi:hypothetical protein